MHIPDGFLDTKTWVTLGVISAGTVGLALSKASKKIGEKQIPLMGVLAAFIFAAQMLNFPVAGGTSGHFMGGVLAAILLGPLAGVLIMAIVLIIQCLVFQDGGLTALGANIFNMGIIGALVGYYLYLGLSRIVASTRGMFINAFIASWLSIVLAAGVCATELAVSGTVPVGVALPAMTGVHGLIGIGEGLITVAVLSLVFKVRPDLLESKKI
jgi:cobalt/nickel transport system permease protein